MPVSRPIAVFGLGYVGSVTAACLAHAGHHVIGVDTDASKIRSIQAGRAPFHEPGLEAIIAGTVAAGSLRATADSALALEASDVALICVGTPSSRNGDLDLTQLTRVLAGIEQHVAARARRLVVAIRSTVFPGVTSEIAASLQASNPHVAVVCNPEFLREGSAVADFMDPSLVVVGSGDETAAAEVAALYEGMGAPPALVSLRTAEMIKYCCNAFHAVKMAFANEVGTLAGALDVDPQQVMRIVCRDTKLNVSAAYLKPAFAFGGSCLPKDLRTLNYRAMHLDLKLPLLEAVLPSNDRHLKRAVERVLESGHQRIGVYGLSFKENTDDLRESPSVTAIERWIGKGRDVRIFDPRIQLEHIYGSNRRFVEKALPHIGRLLCRDIGEMLEWCDCIAITQKPDAEFAARLAAADKPILDLLLGAS